MSCAVRSCRNEVYRRPDLSFFSLPRQHHLKTEWLDVLGIERGDNISNIKVCELHFKPKDFCTGKRQLKTHAVPVLKLGGTKSEPIDSDDEFMEYNSESEPEVIELEPANSSSRSSNVKVKQEKIEDKTALQQESDADEPETGRRPSRRAAREAARKIYNTVKSFGPKADTETFVRSPNPVVSNSSRLNQRLKKPVTTYLKSIPISIDLAMECHEEILSPVQAEALLKAQLEYNMVMKTLRSLKANNVKIICAKEPLPISQSPVSTIANVSKAGNNYSNVINITSSAMLQKSSIVPMVLSTSSL